MAAPPKDSDGNILPYNDPDIGPRDGLLRNVPPDQVVWDDNTRDHRPSSGAFSASSEDGGMSVDLERLMEADGFRFDARVPNGFWLVKLVAGEMRNLDLLVGSDPLDENPYHAQVWGVHNSKKRKKILRQAQVLKRGLIP